MSIKESVLNRYINWKLDTLNNGLDWGKFTKAVGLVNDEIKVVAYYLTDTDETYVFQYGNNAIKWLDHIPVDKTVEIWSKRSVFKAIITGKITPDEAFYGNLVTFSGAHLLREKITANVLFGVLFGDLFDDFAIGPEEEYGGGRPIKGTD